ncbi:hypothetical protein [Nitrososphaera sp.]|uniref:hypothetical protein n=1 Tax=Nitrososphaera sp. TaxID=1971748 RepID=UPI002EDB08C9
MTLNPDDDIVRQIILSYKGYADTLSGEKRKRFDELFSFLYEFVEAINAKGEPFPEEAALVTLVLKQHMIIEDLKQEVASLKGKK